jgi:hypothetical protein
MLRFGVSAACVLGLALLFGAPAAPSAKPFSLELSRSALFVPARDKGFPKKDKKRKRDKETREGGGGSGKCGRLAKKYSLPRDACGQKGGCKRLAETYGLPKSECR